MVSRRRRRGVWRLGAGSAGGAAATATGGAPVAAGAAGGLAFPALPGERRVERLANGLTLCLLDNPQAPVVTTALWFRAGSRDEPAGHGGVAHFLEHMMFKGSSRYGAGEIDRLTQQLGGSNNAFTSHDATAYYFQFARDRWPEALAIEADRMAGLTLDPDEVASEREVILEEVAMYEADPWEALGSAVEEALLRPHPYGRPVLGTRAELRATGGAELAAFHRRFYRPDNAVLVVAGELGEDAAELAERALGSLPAGAEPRPEPAPPAPLGELVRLERRQGEVGRLLLAFRAPAAGHPDHPPLKLLATLLAGGRASRLYRRLVDEEQLATWVAADVDDSLDPGAFTVSLELTPGAEPAAAEARLLGELAALADGGAQAIGEEELERARRVTAADWAFSHERVHQQGLAAGYELALFAPGHLEQELGRTLAAEPAELTAVAARTFVPSAGAVLGWSLPR